MDQNLACNRKSVFGIGTLLVQILASTLAFPAWAGRPLATEDAGVLGQRECEIESYAGRGRDSDEPSVSTRSVQFGCGIGHNTQLAFGIGSERSDGEKSKLVALTGKTFLRELTDEQTGYTLAYTLFAAKEPEDDRIKHNATEVIAVATVPSKGWLFHANLGLHYSKPSKDTTTIWGLAAERTGAVGPVDLMTEIFGDDSSAPWVQVAARWSVIPERFYLDTSWGVQTGNTRSRQITIGLKLAF